jgi:hypothetical protein
VHFGDPKQYSLADRPELRIDPTTIVGTNIQGPGPGFTGITATNTIQNVSQAQVYSVEAAAKEYKIAEALRDRIVARREP